MVKKKRRKNYELCKVALRLALLGVRPTVICICIRMCMKNGLKLFTNNIIPIRAHLQFHSEYEWLEMNGREKCPTHIRICFSSPHSCGRGGTLTQYSVPFVLQAHSIRSGRQEESVNGSSKTDRTGGKRNKRHLEQKRSHRM